MKLPDTINMEPFQEYLTEKIPKDSKHSTSGVVHLSFSKRIKDCLKDPSSADKTFRFYVKKEHFELLNLPNLGLSHVLVLVVPSSDAVQVRTYLASTNLLTCSIIKRFHQECMHGGYKKTYQKVGKGYYSHNGMFPVVLYKSMSACAQHIS